MQGSQSVGICIPTRDQAEFIGDALRSAFSQNILPCDVVISDDAGTDATATVVEQFRLTLEPRLRTILRYHRNTNVLGIGGNFDRAVRLTHGDFVVKLDSDDVLESNFVEVLAEQLQANGQAGWAHCNVLNIQPDGASIGLAHTRKSSGFYPAVNALPAYFRHNDTCHCVMLRKSAYLAVGGYRSEMKTCEDWLLWLEMLFSGWGYYFDERSLARMRKYEARPELMTRRRKDFIASAKAMVPRIESACLQRTPAELGMAQHAALSRFRSAMARLCVSSACDEGDLDVRHALLEAACDFCPSIKNRLWLAAGLRLPAEGIRYGSRLIGTPRRVARALVQHLREKAA